jgi:hypothetical protein
MTVLAREDDDRGGLWPLWHQTEQVEAGSLQKFLDVHGGLLVAILFRGKTAF